MKLERKEGEEPKGKKNIAKSAQIPIYLKNPVNHIIKELTDAEIIHEFATPTKNCSPDHFLPKKNMEKAHLDVDYLSIYGVLKRPAFIIMNPHKGKSSIKESWKVYFNTDMTSGYFQIPLDKKSRELTTFFILDGSQFRGRFQMTERPLQKYAQ